MASSYPRNRISGTAHNIAQSSRELVDENALSATFFAFGFGLAAGVGLVYLFADSLPQRHEASFSEKVGRQVLDALSNVMPETLSKWKH